jgi:F-type H+-transporting ATPase subunit epsilon
MAFFLEISTPEGVVLEREVDSLTVPTPLGMTGIFPGHVPLATLIVPGILQFTAHGQKESLAVDSGFLLLQSNRVSLMLDGAIQVHHIDDAEAENARKRAEEALQKARESALDAQEIARLEAKVRFHVMVQRAGKSR